jgi:signal transduction histidine kinase
MHNREKSWPRFRGARLGIVLTFALLLGAMVSVPPVNAQTLPVFTNLAQLTLATGQTNGLTGNVKLNATVFACSTNSGVLALEDDSGACLLELDGLDCEFQPGDRVEIEGTPSFLGSSDIGVYACVAPTLDNDGLHPAQTTHCQCFFEVGRYPLRLDWFNQFYAFELSCSCVATNSQGQPSAQAPAQTTNLIHAVHAKCFQGFWKQLPNFQLLQPVKVGSASNFDIGFRTRDELVGIRFDGYFDAPRSGNYLFTLRSDDGSRLWIGNTAVLVKKLGKEAVPAAPLAVIGQPMSDLNEHRLATIEGRVDFVSRSGKGLQFELRSDQDSAWVAMADAGDLDPDRLLNTYVRVSGVAGAVFTESQRIVLGRLAVASSRELAIIESASGKETVSSVLKTMMQVQSLSSDDAGRHLGVTLRGVVTAKGYGRGSRWMVFQDDTRGTFVNLKLVTNCIPSIGEFWSISGHTESGNFAPIIIAERATLLGKGRLPEPAHPDWNQLMNGNMDVQWVELQGLVIGVQSNRLSLLLPEGQLEINLPQWGQAELEPFEKAVVCVRGALFAAWNAETHEVQSGSIRVENASISVVKPAPADPFDAPEKTPRGLFRFDVKATPFQRVKVRGQVTYADSQRVFVENGAGIQIIPATATDLHVGDFVEAAGYPEVSVAGPTLREARLRKTDDGVLSPAALIPDAGLGDEHLASMRICVHGNLVGQHTEDGLLVLQVETGTHLIPARVENAESVRSLRLGSRLALTGIYVAVARNRFALFLNSADDLVVISKPSWWTLERLLAAVGMLLVTLALAAVWITLLHRQVAQRTLQLQHEIHEREVAERERSLEAERSRIARDLHDDLGASLTEISVLSSTGQNPATREQSVETLFQAITGKAKELVSALDITVWTLDPTDNSLQLVGDYLCDYAKDYLSTFGIACRFDVPVTLPPMTFDGRRRHELFLAVKETLNNIVRHANATEVEFRLVIADDGLEIVIVDNGRGFNIDSVRGGHGLKNLPLRLSQIGGSYGVESTPGKGTIVKIALKFSQTEGADRGGAG